MKSSVCSRGDVETPAVHSCDVEAKKIISIWRILLASSSLVPPQMSIFRNNDMKVPA